MMKLFHMFCGLWGFGWSKIFSLGILFCVRKQLSEVPLSEVLAIVQGVGLLEDYFRRECQWISNGHIAEAVQMPIPSVSQIAVFSFTTLVHIGPKTD